MGSAPCAQVHQGGVVPIPTVWQNFKDTDRGHRPFASLETVIPAYPCAPGSRISR